ncbi:ArdC family protein [Erythrobacter sp. WG]|uniref:ArdC family protein n=1 Tax=Erythrobacter sp. WG TaxID=2985510 RepID=UPI00226D95BA|nr:zincin-like metallopeptidase domain-containing protein [Erythrobacter sp. WG]MCX9147074.1 zincin-like metallopeptidase domain-containing protein [Erythrobacter sp. WG]
MAKFKRAACSRSPAQRITDAIIEKLEQGTKPWIKPWRGQPVSRPLRACGTPYRGMNTFWLWLMADAAGYSSPYWMTYRQCQKLGGQVRKGEKSTIAIFYKTYEEEVDDAAGGTDTETRRVLKAFAVFNADQCDGLPAMYYPEPAIGLIEPAGREERLDGFFANIGASLRHQGCEAYYEPVADRITMPPNELFDAYEQYYATLAHELSHWTGHSSRLDRNLKNRFGSEAYAAEELVAELSAAILGAELGLPVAHLDHHASYIAAWLDLLKSDERAILTAAAKAEEAASLLLRLGGVVTAETTEDQPALSEAA